MALRFHHHPGNTMGIAYQRAAFLYEHQRYAPAAEEFRRELAASPGSSAAHAMLALCLSKLGQFDAADASAKEAVAADPTNAFAFYTTALVTVRRAHSMMAKLKPFRILLSNARAQNRYARQLRRARKTNLRAIELQPTDADYLGLMAGIEIDLGRTTKALCWANRGLASNPTHLHCANMRARALRDLGLLEEADASLQQALRTNPEDASIHAAKGWSQLSRGDAHLAAEHFAQSARLDPSDVHVHRGLARARFGTYPFIGPVFRGWARLVRFFGSGQLFVAAVIFGTMIQLINDPYAHPSRQLLLEMLGMASFILTTQPLKLWWRRWRLRHAVRPLKDRSSNA